MHSDPLKRAKSYPYRIPGRSYVLRDGGHEELPDGAPAPDLAGRRPILACGSNQSPERLKIKFEGGGHGPMPVIRASLKDFDSVYSAHFSRYGSVPATLQHAPGTTVTLFVNWLTPAQERRMHESESIGFNYDFMRLDGIDLRLEGGLQLDRVYAYVSRRGCILHDGTPIALQAVPAEGRAWRALDQERMLEVARQRLAPQAGLDDFITQTIADEDLRRARTEALEAVAQPFAYGRAAHVAP